MKKKVAKKTTSKKKTKPVYYSSTRYIFLGFASILFILFSFFLFRPLSEAPQRDCANSISCVDNLTGLYEENTDGVFMGNKVNSPALAAKPYDNTAAEHISQTNVLGEATDSKHIYVDLANQKLLAYENNNLVFEFPVSTGKWYPTPTGDFRIWIKLRYTRMKGGSKANGTYYDLPNVPYTMFFYNDKVPKSKGYGIHGAYWHNNFGHPMSHGCVNMKEEDIAKLYEWANPVTKGKTTKATEDNPGTLITIYGETPKE